MPYGEISNHSIGSKLLLIVRHGQAVSNWLGDTLGPDEWFGVEEKCTYTDSNDTTWGVFDAGREMNASLYLHLSCICPYDLKLTGDMLS